VVFIYSSSVGRAIEVILI